MTGASPETSSSSISYAQGYFTVGYSFWAKLLCGQ